MKLIISLLTPLLIGFAGSLTTSSSIDSWYSTLTKPPLTPPGWIFGPVWTILYLMIGLSFYLLWKNNRFEENNKLTLRLFLGQLALNGIWSPAFFGLENPLLGLVVIIPLWAVLLALIARLIKDNQTKLSGWLLVPYLLWVSFATYLNLGILWLN